MFGRRNAQCLGQYSIGWESSLGDKKMNIQKIVLGAYTILRSVLLAFLLARLMRATFSGLVGSKASSWGPAIASMSSTIALISRSTSTMFFGALLPLHPSFSLPAFFRLPVCFGSFANGKLQIFFPCFALASASMSSNTGKSLLGGLLDFIKALPYFAPLSGVSVSKLNILQTHNLKY